MTAMAAAPLLCAGIIGYRCLRLVGIVGDDAGLPWAPRLQRGGAERWPDWPDRDGGAPPAEAPRHLRLRLGRLALHAGRRSGAAGRSTASPATKSTAAMARELGAVWAGESGDDPGVLTDAAIVFAPAGELAVDALRASTRAASSPWAASTRRPSRPSSTRGSTTSAWCAASPTRPAGRRELLRDAAAIPIVSRVQEYELEQANEALLDLKQDRVRGSAVLQVAEQEPAARGEWR